MNQTQYHVLTDTGFYRLNLKMLVRSVKLQRSRPQIWSVRTSTGLLGLPNCPSGNRGPKGSNEILLTVGDAGLFRLIDLGFIPCPICQPEKVEGFWNDSVKDLIGDRYGLSSPAEFADKNLLSFDTGRVDWEALLPVFQQWPNRLYVPKGLGPQVLADWKSRIDKLGYPLPQLGYYNPDIPEKFTSYQLD